MSKLTGYHCFLFFTFLITINFICNVDSQTTATTIPNNNNNNNNNNAEGAKKVSNDFATNLKNNFPSLVSEISKIQFPKSDDPKQNAFTGALFDTVHELVVSRNASKGTSTESSPGSRDPLQTLGSFIISFFVHTLIFGLKALLTPVVLLVEGLLLVVKILLNVVLWIVQSLLSAVLSNLGLGGVNQGIADLLQKVKGLLAAILTQLDEVLNSLSLLSLSADDNNEPSIKRTRRQATRPDASNVFHIPYDIFTYPFRYFVEVILFPIRATAYLIRTLFRAILTFL